MLISRASQDYELLDSGHNQKLERYGKYILIRPETQAIWNPAHPELWRKADAEFQFTGDKGGRWRKNNNKLPETWDLTWQGAKFSIRLTNFKHTGLFPEQAANWQWAAERIKNLSGQRRGQTPGSISRPRVLNLFGYTGIASITAALSGAEVTHVDASKQSNLWAKDNAKLSGIPEGAMRYILDDALAFAERETRRGSEYQGILLDPPAFGRGPNGEIWRIEEHLIKLLTALKKIFSKTPGSFFLLNGYAAGYSPTSFLQSMESVFNDKKMEFGELAMEESGSQRVLPSGIYVRFTR